jgi:hypothetical protein
MPTRALRLVNAHVRLTFASGAARDVLDSRDPVLTVHGVLAEYQAAWLLIFDNVPDRAFVENSCRRPGAGEY